MALHWSIDKVRNYKDLLTGEDPPRFKQSVTERLIYLTMQIDLGSITESNIEEWLVRLAMIETCGWVSSPPPTREELTRHVGLHTNAATRTRDQFCRRLIKHVELEAVARSRRKPQKADQSP